jgi:hypothetical protein
MNPTPNLTLHRWTYLQPDHCLIDGRHFSDVIDVMARRAANIDSDHMASRYKIESKNITYDRLKDRDFASWYYDELESELQCV